MALHIAMAGVSLSSSFSNATLTGLFPVLKLTSDKSSRNASTVCMSVKSSTNTNLDNKATASTEMALGEPFPASRRVVLLSISTLALSLAASQTAAEASSRSEGRLKALEKLKKFKESVSEEVTAVESSVEAAVEAAVTKSSAVVEEAAQKVQEAPQKVEEYSQKVEQALQKVQEAPQEVEDVTASIVQDVEQAPAVSAVEEIKDSIADFIESPVEKVQESVVSDVETVEKPPPASVTEAVAITETPALSSESDVAKEPTLPSGILNLKALIEKGKNGEAGSFTGKLTLSDFK